MDNLQQPDNLSEKGKQAHEAIVEFIKKNGLTCACSYRTFYSPKEWEEREEDYGCDSELIIMHDGGDVSYAFSYEKGNYKMIESLQDILKPLGVYSQQCTCWYSAIYLC